ncbi:MAG TPA: prolyl oligopeptidase family serine peptidase [Bryobacteraceae bacterium]|nr:prolyl oligopeptidase family serine peptidase [Bryobacteraceae bacterium]
MRLLRPLLLLWLALGALCAASRPDWKVLREQIKTTLHVPDPLPELDSKFYGQFSPAAGISAERVSYRTDYGLRVPAIVYHSSGATITKHPALVVVNGHGGDKSSWYSYWTGIVYARAGAIVLTYDPIGEYERNRERASNTSQHDTLVPPDDMGRRMGGLMITDIMQAAHYLAERPDVDPKRVAVLGFSMGSFISSLACAVDTSVRACVLVGGGDLDGPGGYWDASGKKMCQAIPYQSLAFLGDRGPILYALHAKRGPTLVFNGTADQVVDIPHHAQDFFENLRKQTIATLGGSKDVFDFAFTPGGGHRPYFLTKPVALWLQEKLTFPNWTKKQIQAMPETHISEWALQNHLQTAVTPAYEVGQGGTLALGNDIPAVPRDSLRAIPEALWQSDQASYIYETWVERAQAALTPPQLKP